MSDEPSDWGRYYADTIERHIKLARELQGVDGPHLPDDFRWFVRCQIRQHRTAEFYYRQRLFEWLDSHAPTVT